MLVKNNILDIAITNDTEDNILLSQFLIEILIFEF